MYKLTQNEILEAIKDSGLKNTPHRFEILNRIVKAKTPIAVTKLIDDLQKKIDIDQATIYRNLLSLVEAGLIRRYDYNHGHAHYEFNKEGENVVYQMVCSNCETIERMKADFLEDSVKKMIKKSKKFKTTTNVNVEVYGLCKGCA